MVAGGRPRAAAVGGAQARPAAFTQVEEPQVVERHVARIAAAEDDKAARCLAARAAPVREGGMRLPRHRRVRFLGGGHGGGDALARDAAALGPHAAVRAHPGAAVRATAQQPPRARALEKPEVAQHSPPALLRNLLEARGGCGGCGGGCGVGISARHARQRVGGGPVRRDARGEGGGAAERRAPAVDEQLDGARRGGGQLRG